MRGREEIPTPRDIKQRIDRTVIGNDDAKQRFVAAVWLFRQVARLPGAAFRVLGRTSGNGILLLGASGCGKTLLVRAGTEAFGDTVVVADATRQTESGYVGAKADDLLVDLLDRFQGDLDSIYRHGVLFVDEICKKARVETNGTRDVSGEGAQQALLKMHDPGSVTVHWQGKRVAIEPSRILIIYAGAFAGLPEIIAKRLGIEPLDALAQVGTDDLVAYGMIPEWVGRLGVILPLAPPAAADVLRILEESEESLLPGFRELFASHGISLRLSRGARLALARKVVETGTGARGLACGRRRSSSPSSTSSPTSRRGACGGSSSRERS